MIYVCRFVWSLLSITPYPLPALSHAIIALLEQPCQSSSLEFSCPGLFSLDDPRVKLTSALYYLPPFWIFASVLCRFLLVGCFLSVFSLIDRLRLVRCIR
ncbi:uncharacterized protein EI90DRAFT_700663 [Cantharellus anzutake]|uniref:uncharacterized protein n=1 Tax=Cantharellus anzutake TaxID=1750568 RepID=UPI001908DB21|nr:uncharacterized protein EI90DRAFT_700663 [Cantharellus anzutake]KAF8332762.1 hypothetical protein EI90DRAFT_700663 [Cantharellus anzutake]